METVKTRERASMTEIETKQQKCPNCGTLIPVDLGYVPWCDHCGWNVKPQEPEKPKNIWEKMYARLGQTASQSLFEKLNRHALMPTTTPSRFAGNALAILVHCLTIASALSGLALLILGWPNFFAIFVSIILMGIAWIMFPRFSKKSDKVLSRDEFPMLYALADRISDALHAPPIDLIEIDAQFNASITQVGWKRQWALTIGLPLWEILDNREKLDFLAHEIAHSVNQDPSRGFLVGTAINALINWYVLLHPGQIWASHRGIVGIFMIPFNLIMWGLAGLAWLGLFVLCHLFWRDSQRAEYYADHLGATVSGTGAAINCLRKCYFGPTFLLAVQRERYNHDENLDFFDTLRQYVTQVPERELERKRRVELLQNSRLDVTHPPTPYRIQLLQSGAELAAQDLFSKHEFELLHQELKPIRSQIQRKLIGR